MTDRTGFDIVDDWQSGAGILLATVIVGVVGALAGRSALGDTGVVVGFLAGIAVGFVIVSYLLYGR